MNTTTPVEPADWSRIRAARALVLLLTALQFGCAPTIPPGPAPGAGGYSQTELQGALGEAADLAGMDAGQKADLLANVPVGNASDKDPRGGDNGAAFKDPNSERIFVVPARLAHIAPPAGKPGSQPETVRAVLKVLLYHEIYHLTPPAPGGGGGQGPPQSGVPGGTDCLHIGLQVWGVRKGCIEVDNLHSFGDFSAAKAVCELIKGMAAAVAHTGSYYAASRECEQNGHSTTEGPPTWGFDHPPFGGSGNFHFCERCALSY
jgi:hypothetical protein